LCVKDGGIQIDYRTDILIKEAGIFMLSSKKNGSQLTIHLKGKLIASNVEAVKSELLQLLADDILHLGYLPAL